MANPSDVFPQRRPQTTTLKRAGCWAILAWSGRRRGMKIFLWSILKIPFSAAGASRPANGRERRDRCGCAQTDARSASARSRPMGPQMRAMAWVPGDWLCEWDVLLRLQDLEWFALSGLTPQPPLHKWRGGVRAES